MTTTTTTTTTTTKTTELIIKEEEQEYEDNNTTWNKLMEASLCSEEEGLIVNKFQEIVSRQYPYESQITHTLIRFLRARKFDIEQSEQLYNQRQLWIRTYKPHLISEMECMKELSSGQAYWGGVDKHQRPTLILRASLNDPTTYTQDDYFKCIIYMMEYGRKRLPPPPFNQYIVMYDLKGISKKNLDLNSLKKFSSLGDYYPELLGCVYLLRPHWMLSFVFGMIRHVMDPVTQQKVKIVKEDMFQTLLDDYSADQLELDFGGNASYDTYPPVHMRHNCN